MRDRTRVSDNEPFGEHARKIVPPSDEQVCNYIAQQIGTLALCMYAVQRSDYIQAKLLLHEVERNLPAAVYMLRQVQETAKG
jgi:hypothetical protein